MNSVRGKFGRRVESLQPIFDMTAAFFADHGLDPGLLPVVDLAVEELFTNMVKYNKESGADVSLELTRLENGVEVTLIDYDVEPFDMTRAPDVDTGKPAQDRRPGGLGIHLVRKMVDSLEYRYQDRQSRITFRKTTGEGHVSD